MLNGLIGKKIEMSQVWPKDDILTPVTILEVGPCIVTQVKNSDKEGYIACQLGFGQTKEKNLKKTRQGHFKGLEVNPAILKEIRLTDEAESVAVGTKLSITDVFGIGDKVEITATSKGKGFAGVVKRHGFHGGPKTHGQSDRHRAPGSIGGGTDPGHVYKGKRMAGRMGGETVKVKGLEIIEIDSENNLIKVKGAVPGYRGTILTVIKEKNGGK